MSTAVILGSAFDGLAASLEPRQVHTREGEVTLFEAGGNWVLFRHGRPHRWLPNQVPYRAHALALQAVGVQRLVVTSSVGVMQPELPVGVPMLVGDLVWFDNRLPDGSACTVFDRPGPDQGHLVLEHGLFHPELAQQIRAIAARIGVQMHPDPVDFWYAPGPRTKTAAENRVLAALGLQVNSMTLAPEVVLAAELGMAVAGLVAGHKPSGPGLGEEGVRASLVDARQHMESLVRAVLSGLKPVSSRNHLYRY